MLHYRLIIYFDDIGLLRLKRTIECVGSVINVSSGRFNYLRTDTVS